MVGEENMDLLTLYGDIQSRPVKWLWYPYIADRKITLVQGDPNGGKSSMMMQIIAAVSKGSTLPDGTQISRPYHVIYQCSEDDPGDTIRPRLEVCGADCMNVAFINERVHDGLTLDDERIRQAILEFRPRLVVIDPIQSYIGNDSDLQMATKARRLMRRLSLWASEYNCAVVLIGHLSKREGGKDLYRGLGSIDVVANARSVLHVERDGENEGRRIVRQIKNNLAPNGDDLFFEITKEHGFRWLKNDSVPEKEKQTEQIEMLPKNKHELAAILLKRVLFAGPVESTKIKKMFSEYRIGEKTMQKVKADLGIKSYRKMRTWYWVMPKSPTEGEGNGE